MSRVRTDTIVSSDTTSSVDFPNGLSSAGITVNGSIVKTGGTSSQYLMADGSVSTAGVGINEDRGSFNELDAALFS